NVYWDLKVFSKDQLMAEAVALISEPSKMELKKPEPEFIMKRENDGHLIKLGIRSNAFAKGFEIDFNGVSGKYSDNFIDLLPGVWYWINFEPVDTKEINESYIKFNWRCFRFSN
ncbi:MAG: glycoside hydrolase family 2 protein, partial [Bacteroidota bacterium]